jgi:hypothetical protein
MLTHREQICILDTTEPGNQVFAGFGNNGSRGSAVAQTSREKRLSWRLWRTRYNPSPGAPVFARAPRRTRRRTQEAAALRPRTCRAVGLAKAEARQRSMQKNAGRWPGIFYIVFRRAPKKLRTSYPRRPRNSAGYCSPQCRHRSSKERHPPQMVRRYRRCY